MAVPDKRACFDFFKPISTIGSWLEPFLSGRDRPTLIQVFNQNSLHCRYRLNGEETSSFSAEWIRAKITASRTLKQAYEWLIRSVEAKDNSYHDVHCWAFTPKSLHVVLCDLAFIGLSRLSVEEVSDANGNEFYVHLRNLGAGAIDEPEFYAKREELLHAAMDECAYNSHYVYAIRENPRRSNEEVDFLEGPAYPITAGGRCAQDNGGRPAEAKHGVGKRFE